MAQYKLPLKRAWGCYWGTPNLYSSLLAKLIKIIGLEPWSSDFGMRLKFKRSWVWIPTPYVRWIISHIFMLYKIILMFENTENNRKRGCRWPIYKLMKMLSSPGRPRSLPESFHRQLLLRRRRLQRRRRRRRCSRSTRHSSRRSTARDQYCKTFFAISGS